jgi:two-component system response regulator YesN
MAYKCLIVDDEEDVIITIINRLDWQKMGYEEPDYAHNGVEGLEKAGGNIPDVVLTDIRMPYMDGLELSRLLKEEYPNIKIIIISGFDEFEYAKEAIHLEAEEYILKPIDMDELEALFNRIKISLDKEAEERQSIKKLSKYYAESLPALQENFFAALIEGRVEENKIDNYLLNYQIDLRGPRYCIVEIHTSKTKAPEGINPVLLDISVRRLAEEKLHEKWNGRFFSYLGNTVMIAQLQNEAEVIDLTDSLDRFVRLSENACNAVVTAGIGTISDDLSELSESFAGAEEAVSYRAIYGTGKAINIAEVAPSHPEDDSTEDSEKDLMSILRRIRVGKDIDIERSVADLFGGKIKGKSLQQYKFFVMDTMSRMYHFTEENLLNSEKIFGRYTDMKEIDRLDLGEFESLVSNILKKLQNDMDSTRIGTNKEFVIKAEQYVQENYSEVELSVDKICKTLAVSSAYFSTVFKRDTGKTFIEYLTDYRMEEASKLLLNDNLKTYVIAERVGYSDPNYFTYVFKRKYGLTPSKYRKEKI